MPEHYRTLSAVFPIIIGNENGKMKVLLARRMNTGYMDGMWDFAGSGHVDRVKPPLRQLSASARRSWE